MSYVRRFKGASSFLESSGRGGRVADSSRSSAIGSKSERARRKFETMVLRVFGRTRSANREKIAEALDLPLPQVDEVCAQLQQDGFLEQAEDEGECKLTEAGIRALRYTKLADF